VVGQQHELHPLYDSHPQLLQQSRDEHSDATRLVSVPGLATPDASVLSTVPPRVPVISHRSTISYRKIRPSDLEVLQEIHEALFPIK
jgi:hypothetical protein